VTGGPGARLRLPSKNHRQYNPDVNEDSIPKLRNHDDVVVDRIDRGGPSTLSLAGETVTPLPPLGRRALSAAALVRRWSKLPPMDPAALRRDVDAAVADSNGLPRCTFAPNDSVAIDGPDLRTVSYPGISV